MEPTVTLRNKQTGELRVVPQSYLPFYGIGRADTLSLLKKYFPSNQLQNAYNIMMLESKGNPQAVGDQYPIQGEVRPSYGLFQIRTFPDRPIPEALVHPEVNIAYAAKLFREQGWKPWWNSARKLGLL